MVNLNFFILALVGLGLGSAYSLVALGFSFLLKTTDSFNFAQGTLLPIGGLVTYSAYTIGGLWWGLALLLVLVVTAILGGLTERVAVYPLVRRGDPPLLWLMSTLGVSVLLTGAALRIWGPEPQAVAVYFGPSGLNFGDSSVPTPYLWAFSVGILMTIAIYIFERYTPWGRTMRAIADNRAAVRLSGINVLVYSLAAYMVAGALTGLGGFLIVPVTYASVGTAFTFTMLGFAAMAIGGFGSHLGALLGGWIVGLVEAIGGAIFGLQYSTFMVFIVVLIILMLRPAGLFSSRNVRTV